MFKEMPEELDYLLNGDKTAKPAKSKTPEKPSKSKTPEKPSKSKTPEKPAKAKPAAVEDDMDWSLSDGAVSKIRSSFEKLSEGEEELAYSKAMKTFLKSGVKPKDVSGM